VYDITSFESFEGAKSWVRELKLYGQPNVVVALAANKCDLEQYRAVSTHEGQAYARENELTYVETSAKSAHNVRHMFVELAQRVPRKDASAMTSNTSLENGQHKGGGCAC
jgi:Ras-related protein Rab-5C